MHQWLMDNDPDSLNEKGEITVPLAKQSMLQFFGWKCRKAMEILEAGVNNDGDPESVSSVRGYRSALVSLYTAKKLAIQPELDKELSIFLDGYEKTYAELRKRGLVKISEGKKALKSAGSDDFWADTWMCWVRLPTKARSSKECSVIGPI
jgi:hypothetical protein